MVTDVVLYYFHSFIKLSISVPSFPNLPLASSSSVSALSSLTQSFTPWGNLAKLTYLYWYVLDRKWKLENPLTGSIPNSKIGPWSCVAGMLSAEIYKKREIFTFKAFGKHPFPEKLTLFIQKNS